MRSCGYQTEILNGWFWDSSDNVFKDYILEKYKDKQESKKDSVEYTLAKLFLNALYGKTNSETCRNQDQDYKR